MNRILFACTLGACVSVVCTPKVRAATKVSLSIGDVRMAEPPSDSKETPSGQKSMIFPVTLSGVWSEDVRISYATSVGPNATTADSSTLAQPGFDFSRREGQLTIPAGSTRGQIEVPILADGEVEKDETFLLTLSNVVSSDNSGATVTVARSVAKGTIVESVKGIVLGGKVLDYEVAPFISYDPITGRPVDTFDAPAQAVGQSGVSVSVMKGDITRSVTTDKNGNFSILVLPGSYSVQIGNFSKTKYSNDLQTYSLPARTISLSRDSRSNIFAFYGVAGNVGVRSTFNPKTLSFAYVQVEARPVGAAASSPPTSTAIAYYTDLENGTRGNSRFFIPALPPGRYTLTVKDVDGSGYNYTTNYSFPTVTVSLPTSSGENQPDVHVSFIGTPKTTTTTSSSAGGS